jgi:FkbM family methyltransferase
MSKLSRSLSRMKQLVLAVQPFWRERQTEARRELLWRFLQGEAETISFERGGVHWSGPVGSSITGSLFSRGSYQHEAIDLVAGWLTQNCPRWHDCPTIVNIGANIGDTSIALALKTGRRVLACEPVPELFQLLEKNVLANGLHRRIDCRQLAIAEQAGQAQMLCPSEPEYAEIRSASGAQGFPHAVAGCRSCWVPTVPLDCWLEDEQVAPGDVGLVWSDTQGYESAVIASGANLWPAGVPLWVEVWPRGLEVHGGTERFLGLAQCYFRRFVAEGELGDGCPCGNDISGLASLVQALRGRAFTDVLLLP